MSPTAPPAASALIVLLVHGAFADASGWTGVVHRLQAAGVKVIPPANPLRGISHRFRLHRQVLGQIPRASTCRRTLLRRSGHHQRRHQR